ncbi:hypothetical protein STRDD10_02018 [Streptococcus sp. DD10]|nr:hypothetical protein STRDD10_02018 [Streptococcus sp. DD10]
MNQYAIIDRLGYYFIGYGEKHFPEYSKDSLQTQLYPSESLA